jgi:hypothetical protein
MPTSLGRNIINLPWPGGAVVGLPAGSPDTSLSRFPYTLEVYDATDVLKAELYKWDEPKWVQTANLPSTLEFTYPSGDEFAAFLTGFYQIGIRDSKGVLVDLLPITETVEPRSGSTNGTISVKCVGSLGNLGVDKSVTSYTIPGGGTIQAALSTILGTYQGAPLYPDIKLGYIAPSIGNAVRAGEVYKNMTPLAVINSLWKTVGGYFWVDTSRRLNWTPAQGSYGVQEVRLGHNMTGIKVKKQFNNIYTSVTMYGYGMDIDSRLSSTQTNNVGTYGTRQFFVTDTSIQTQTALDEACTALVMEMSQPQETYQIGVIDLSKGDDASDYEHLAGMLEVGTHLNVVSTDPDVTISTTVVKLTRNLGRPIDVQIEVSDPDAGAWGGNSVRRSRRSNIARHLTSMQNRISNLYDRDMGFDRSLYRNVGIDSATGEVTPPETDEPLYRYSTWDPTTGGGSGTGTLKDHVADLSGQDPDDFEEVTPSYTSATLAGLPEVDAPALGYVSAGDDLGNYHREGDAATGEWVDQTPRWVPYSGA